MGTRQYYIQGQSNVFLERWRGKCLIAFRLVYLISKVHCGITWFIRLHRSVLDLLFEISLQADMLKTEVDMDVDGL